MRRIFYTLVAWLGCALTAGSVQAQAPYAYAITPVLTGNYAAINAFGINNRGDVVGSVYQSSLESYGVLYANGVATRLGTLGGTAGTAYDINDNGVAVGYSTTAAGVYHATLYRNGTVTDLTPGLGEESSASAINNAGVAVGAFQCNCGLENRASIFYNGQVVNLGTLDGGRFSGATDINAAGDIVGWSSLENGLDHAILYRNGVMTDLGAFGGNTSSAAAINDRGQIVGGIQRSLPQESRGFLWEDGGATLLPTLPGYGSEPIGLNNSGLVVGILYGPASLLDFHGVLWQDGQPVLLDSLIDPALGWTITQASDVNDAGQIAATGCNAALGVCGILRLDPRSPVPEPGSAAMLVAGLVGLVGLCMPARRRRWPPTSS